MEQAPAWGIPRLMAMQNLQHLWADARQRVRDSFAVEMKAVGGEATPVEDMGDISVSGDHTETHQHYHYPAPPSVMPTVLKKCLPLAATLALGGVAGIAAPLVLNWWNKPTPAVTQPIGKDWQIGVQVTDKP